MRMHAQAQAHRDVHARSGWGGHAHSVRTPCTNICQCDPESCNACTRVCTHIPPPPPCAHRPTQPRHAAAGLAPPSSRNHGVFTPDTSPPADTSGLPSAHAARRTLASPAGAHPQTTRAHPDARTGRCARAPALAGRGAAFPLPLPSINSLPGSPARRPTGTHTAPTRHSPQPHAPIPHRDALIQGAQCCRRRRRRRKSTCPAALWTGSRDNSGALAPTPPCKVVARTRHNIGREGGAAASSAR